MVAASRHEVAMATLLETIHQSQPAFCKAVNERLNWKRRYDVANFSRSQSGRQREQALKEERDEIWKRTEPVIQAHKALMRAYLTAQGMTMEADNGKDSKGRPTANDFLPPARHNSDHDSDNQ